MASLRSGPVQQFFCLDEPPGPYDTLPESRVRLSYSTATYCDVTSFNYNNIIYKSNLKIIIGS